MNDEILQAIASVVQVDANSQWIHLLPAGDFEAVDGRGPYQLRDPQKVIEASKRPMTDLVIDRDHQIDYAPKGTPIIAAGWIKEMQARGDGIWARVEWTETAKQQLAAREYRYLSPVFNFNKTTGEVLRILRAALTNNPALELTALATAETQNQTKQEKDPMNKTLAAIAALLSLGADVKEDEVLAACTAQIESAKKDSDSLAKLRQALGHDDKADVATVLATAEKMATGEQKKPDPAEYVPMSAHQELANSLSALQKERNEEKAEVAVNAAIKAGKVTPAQKEWATDYALKDIAAFNKFVENAPVVIAHANGDIVDKKARNSEDAVTDADLAVCAQLGIDPKSLQKTGEDKAA